MGVYRLYTGSDGESHIEEIKAEALQAIKITGTMSFSVQERAPGHFMDFHPAPFRRWQVGLVGRTTIGLSDAYWPGWRRQTSTLSTSTPCARAVATASSALALWSISSPLR